MCRWRWTLNNNDATPVDFTEQALLGTLKRLQRPYGVIKPTEIVCTPEGLALQRRRGEMLGIANAQQMSPQELLEALLKL